MNYRNKIIQGDVLTVLRELPADLVDCVVTSPPYWGLRDYGIEGQIGLEKTPQEYIAKMVEVFREVRRVLKPEGTLWLNIGDSYAGSGSPGSDFRDGKGGDEYLRPYNRKGNGLKPKDLCGIPWRVALALQADGWYLRSDIIWSKPNPMPESVADRPTKSHEYVFLLVKSERYFFNQEAVREPHGFNRWSNNRDVNASVVDEVYAGQVGKTSLLRKGKINPFPNSGRNIRSVWTIATQPFPGAHFATFPEALVEPCIKAGTSEKGYCPECGKAWVRVVEKTGGTIGKSWVPHKEELKKGMSEKDSSVMQRAWENGDYQVKTIDCLPSCQCEKEPIPGLVLDPFSGSGTVASVAFRLGLDYLGIELNPNYIDMGRKRLAMTPCQKELF